MDIKCCIDLRLAASLHLVTLDTEGFRLFFRILDSGLAAGTWKGAGQCLRTKENLV